MKSVYDLEVFKKAYEISLEIHKASLELPVFEQQKGLADQLRRASKGICANLAEGFGRQSISTPDFKRFIVMAIGSADEMQLWITYCSDLNYIQSDKADTWKSTYREIAMMLSGLHKNWK